MNRQTIFILIAAVAFGAWYAKVGGRKVTKEHVEALYSDYISAFDRGDGEAVCKLFSDDVSGRFRSTSRSMPVNEVTSKASACSAVDNFKTAKARLEQAVGREPYTNLEYTIGNITVAADGRSATAEVLLEFRIGTEESAILDMRSTQVDVIKRNFGKSQFSQSDGTVSFYK